MEFGKAGVGALQDSGSAIGCGAKSQDCAGFGAGGGFDRDYGTGCDFGLGFEGGFEVFGVEIDAGGGDDGLAFAAEEAKFSGGLGFGEVTGG